MMCKETQKKENFKTFFKKNGKLKRKQYMWREILYFDTRK